MIDPRDIRGLDPDDVRLPEYIIDGMGEDGAIHKVPILHQREGEAIEDFMDRMDRVSRALGYDCLKTDRSGLHTALLLWVPICIFIWIMIWGLGRRFL